MAVAGWLLLASLVGLGAAVTPEAGAATTLNHVSSTSFPLPRTQMPEGFGSKVRSRTETLSFVRQAQRPWLPSIAHAALLRPPGDLCLVVTHYNVYMSRLARHPSLPSAAAG